MLQCVAACCSDIPPWPSLYQVRLNKGPTQRLEELAGSAASRSHLRAQILSSNSFCVSSGAVCCSALQHVAACCSMLTSVAVYCRVL